MKRAAAASVCLALMMVAPAAAQTVQQRIDAVRRQRTAPPAQAAAQAAPEPSERAVQEKLRQVIELATLEESTAREAFNWWSERTGVPLVINWQNLQAEGIDPATPINLRLRDVPAIQMLQILMQQATPYGELIHEVTPWYVRVMTKREANRQPVLRVYDVADLLMEVPHFNDAPEFDLGGIFEGGIGQGGGGGGSSLFEDDERGREEEQPLTRAQRGQQLAQVIRDTIEPELWQANGGQSASIRYSRGRLVVNAPLYVHRQIGIPVITPRVRPTFRSLAEPPRTAPRSAFPYQADRSGRAGGVSGITGGTTRISGTR